MLSQQLELSLIEAPAQVRGSNMVLVEHVQERNGSFTMSDTDWYAVSDKIRAIIASNQKRLDAEKIAGIVHYLDVDEYEMALELLCLALMRISDATLLDLEAAAELAKQVGLDRESVFDDNFWANFSTVLTERLDADAIAHDAHKRRDA